LDKKSWAGGELCVLVNLDGVFGGACWLWCCRASLCWPGHRAALCVTGLLPVLPAAAAVGRGLIFPGRLEVYCLQLLALCGSILFFLFYVCLRILIGMVRGHWILLFRRFWFGVTFCCLGLLLAASIWW
jgi:hypothetical protein